MLSLFAKFVSCYALGSNKTNGNTTVATAIGRFIDGAYYSDFGIVFSRDSAAYWQKEKGNKMFIIDEETGNGFMGMDSQWYAMGGR